MNVKLIFSGVDDKHADEIFGVFRNLSQDMHTRSGRSVGLSDMKIARKNAGVRFEAPDDCVIDVKRVGEKEVVVEYELGSVEKQTTDFFMPESRQSILLELLKRAIESNNPSEGIRIDELKEKVKEFKNFDIAVLEDNGSVKVVTIGKEVGVVLTAEGIALAEWLTTAEI